MSERMKQPRTRAKGRPFKAYETLNIMHEASQLGTSKAEVRRRHPLEATGFYCWQREVEAAMRQTLREEGVVETLYN